MIEWLGPIIHEYYAGSEGGGFCYIEPRGVAGAPRLGRQVAARAPSHIVDEDGDELPTGEAGQVWFESPHRFEYHGDPEKTARRCDDRGLEHARRRRLRRRRGLPVPDRPGVEHDHLGRREHLPTGDRGRADRPPRGARRRGHRHSRCGDGRGGPGGRAARRERRRRPGPPAELIAYCREPALALQVPTSVVFVDELPRLPSGKLLKRLLREPAGPAETDLEVVMPTPRFEGVIGDDWRTSTPWWPAEPAPPAGAPNVVLVVLDDVGFAQLGVLRLRHQHPHHQRAAHLRDRAACPSEPTARTIDVRGKMVTPGLIDLHAHVFDGVNSNGVLPRPGRTRACRSSTRARPAPGRSRAFRATSCRNAAPR